MSLANGVTDVMVDASFIPITEMKAGVPSVSFWNPDRRIEVLVSSVCDSLLVKGMKKYFVRGQGKHGRTYVRDLPRLMTYMEEHFPEAHLYLAFFRDISDGLAPGHDDLQHLMPMRESAQHRRAELKPQLEERLTLSKLAGKTETARRLTSLLRAEAEQLSLEDAGLCETIKEASERIAHCHELVAAYSQHGRATVLAFGYSTPLFKANLAQLPEIVDSVVADVMNTHRRSVRQKLEGGQLQVYIQELHFPWVFYSAEAVGVFAPRQFERLLQRTSDEGLAHLEEQLRSAFILTPSSDIDVDGARTHACRIPGQAFRSFLSKVEQVEKPARRTSVPKEGIWIGNMSAGGSPTDTPYLLPLEYLLNAYCSGASGSGKSFFGRVLVEGAIAEGVRVIVLDPGSQWGSLSLPEDRDNILKRYKAFAISPESARGFPGTYHPLVSATEALPADIHKLAGPSHIFSLKALSKSQACHFASRLLTALFQSHAVSESGRLRTLVVIDEAHRLTRRPSDEKSDRQLISRAEEAIDLIGREGRKYGLNVLVISQTIRDFSHAVATLRQNTGTKVFFRNSDLEIDYAKGYLSDPSVLTRLKKGEAVIYNADHGEARIVVRPPFSKVIELSQTELAKALGLLGDASSTLEPLEEDLLRVAREHFGETGSFIASGKAMDRIGLKSVRRQQKLLAALEHRGLIRTERSSAPGNPRLIIPLDD